MLHICFSVLTTSNCQKVKRHKSYAEHQFAEHPRIAQSRMLRRLLELVSSLAQGVDLGESGKVA